MNVLITGGAGFIGSQLGFYFLGKGHKVILVDNLQFGYEDNITKKGKLYKHFYPIDIRDPKSESIMKGVDVVFHLAGVSALPECNYNPFDAYSTNTAGTAQILEFSRRNGVRRVIFSSTSAVYENNTKFPLKESDKVNPELIYSLSKKHAEDICHSYSNMYGMDICILRFFNVYGPHMDYLRPNPPLVSYIIKCLLDGKVPVLHSNGKQKRDMIFVEDVLRMCEVVMTHPKAKNSTFNVGTGKAYSVREVYSEVAKNFNTKQIEPIYRNPSMLWEKYQGLYEGKYPFKKEYLIQEVNKYTLASTVKAKKLLGWKAETSLKEGIHQTVSFAKNDYEKRKKML